jgi:hypothetical protein
MCAACCAVAWRIVSFLEIENCVYEPLLLCSMCLGYRIKNIKIGQ